MSYNFVATEDFIQSHKNVNTLLQFAIDEDLKDNQDNRNLFLKLSIVVLVTRFQVYVESVLKEFEYRIKASQKKNKDIPLHYRLNSIKLIAEKRQLHIELQDPSKYDKIKFKEVEGIITMLGEWCNEVNEVHQDLLLETKFPLGATGLKELKKLFKQINGEDIFANANFDIEKLNEILSRRHAIIHEDKNQQITELIANEYRVFLKTVADHIDSYLLNILK